MGGKKMEILLIMGLGVLVGNRFFPKKHKKLNEKLQVLCTIVLIFSMGVMLGKRENFLQELSTLGAQSFLFFLVPTVFSVIFVFLLTRWLMEKNNDKKEN